jgi:hypothetical protein
MEADFSGWATKAGLKCSDGRTIMPDAFKHQDSITVPLVWQHGHNTPENVLGHAILENRDEGVYAYCFFNDTTTAAHAKGLVKHRDINALSIWANQLIERGGRVLHGMIREVSLVLSGANPGALIDTINIAHGDGETILEDEAIIYTGLELEHADKTNKGDTTMSDTGEMTVQDVYDSMTQEQKDVVHFMIGTALENANDSMAQSSIDAEEITNALNEIKEGIAMSHNIFDQTPATNANTISHSDVQAIMDDAKKRGSFADAMRGYALAHNITNVDLLFPDAKNILTAPEWNKRRTEWVTNFINGATKSPFSRIKTLSADLTYDQARAKGYVKASFKKEEFFSIGKRVTTPTTVYKKQKLDRDDMVDITDLDVVAWLKAEMRLMLDEEIARAALVGDGRDPSDTDKISETNIRPIAKDNELFTTTINVNLDDASSSMLEVSDAIISARKFYKGTGLPNMYMSESYIAKFLTSKYTDGRRIYTNITDLASELRVAEIVGCEILEDDPSIVAILVNPVDYTMGATAGGEVSMFENFDIDYNQQKYLIETRMCGALTKLKSAMVVKKVASTVTLVSPTKPTMATTGTDAYKVVIPTVTGVSYFLFTADAITASTTTAPTYTRSGSALTAGAQTAITAGATAYIGAEPSSASYAFNTSSEDFWAFSRPTA